MQTSPHLFANMQAAGSELEIICIFVNPNGNGNKLTCTNWWEMRAHKQVFQETGKKRENTIIQRSLLVTRFMLELQKLLIIFSNKGVRLLLGSFAFFITCSSLHENYGWRLGVSSNRCITVQRDRLTREIEKVVPFFKNMDSHNKFLFPLSFEDSYITTKTVIFINNMNKERESALVLWLQCHKHIHIILSFYYKAVLLF